MRLFYYQFKNMTRSKGLIFWTLAFPIILGTLFFVAFGNLENDSSFKKIPIAVVYEQENSFFEKVLDSVTGDLFVPKEYSEKKAMKQLRDEKVEAIIMVGDDISVRVMKSSIEASIVEIFVNEYIASQDAIEDILTNSPQSIEKLSKFFSVGDNMELSEVNLDEGNIHIKDMKKNAKDYSQYTIYFYALIAMTCLFGGNLSQYCIYELQGDQSMIGARKNVAPVSKFKLLLVDVLVCWLIVFLEVMFVLFYLVRILGLDFGGNLYYMSIMGLIGSFCGISLGIFLGIFIKGDKNKKDGVALTINLTLSFLGGLMIHEMIHAIEKSVPIINRINPAALLVQAAQSLQIYDTDAVFYQNMLVLFIIGVALNIASLVIIGRKKYASI